MFKTDLIVDLRNEYYEWIYFDTSVLKRTFTTQDIPRNMLYIFNIMAYHMLQHQVTWVARLPTRYFFQHAQLVRRNPAHANLFYMLEQ